MGKSILAIDTPESCAECPCSDDCAEVCRAIDTLITEVNGECKKPDWCPLRYFPDKYKPVSMNFERGWNACIDEILKGANKNE